MIEEVFCSFEVAKLLKEKGFSERSYGAYNLQGEFQEGHGEWNKTSIYYAAPTHQMAMAWLREEKDIIVNVWYNGVDYATEYFEPNTQTEVGKFVFIGDGYYAYENAVEAALKYCLKNLI